MAGATIFLASLPLVLTILLAIPVSLTIYVERTVALRTSWRVRWLFGLVEVRSERRQARPRESPHPDATRTSRPRRSPGSRPGRGGKMALAALRTRGFARRLVRLLTDLLHHVHCDHLSLHMRVGLDDPADTGRVYGALSPLLAAAAGGGFAVRCQPDFSGPCLEGSGVAALRLRPLSVIGALVVFMCSPLTLHTMRAIRRAGR